MNLEKLTQVTNSLLIKNLYFQIVFVLQAQYEPEETELTAEVGYHGDFVKDVAFEVENLDYILEYARSQGAMVVRDLWEERDEHGVVRMAVLKTVGRHYCQHLWVLCTGHFFWRA